MKKTLCALFVCCLLLTVSIAFADFDILSSSVTKSVTTATGMTQTVVLQTSADVQAISFLTDDQITFKHLDDSTNRDGSTQWQFNVYYEGAGDFAYEVDLLDKNKIRQASKRFTTTVTANGQNGSSTVFEKGSSPAFTADIPSFNAKGIEVWPISLADARIQSKTGPGDKYAGGGAYKNPGIVSLSAYFIEKGTNWMYVDLNYDDGAYLRRLYFKTKDIDYEHLPLHEFEDSAKGVMLQDTEPVFGPDRKYDHFTKGTTRVVLPEGESVTVLCEENDYLFIECDSTSGLIRIWVPEENVGY